MNGFQPAWAEEALKPVTQFDRTHYKALQEFYNAWLAYHSIQKDKAHKAEQFAAGEELLKRHNLISSMRAGMNNHG